MRYSKGQKICRNFSRLVHFLTYVVCIYYPFLLNLCTIIYYLFFEHFYYSSIHNRI
jgi:hypothetical protein